MMLALLGGAGLLLACSDEGDTIINNYGLDCGLVAAHLRGAWQVQFTGAARTLQACDNPAADGIPVDIEAAVAEYAPVSVFGSDESASFQVFGDRSDLLDDPTVNPELVAGVEADSCLAFFQVWDEDDGMFVQCIGTIDIAAATPNLVSFCDSVEIDADLDGVTDYSCDLNASATVDLQILAL